MAFLYERAPALEGPLNQRARSGPAHQVVPRAQFGHPANVPPMNMLPTAHHAQAAGLVAARQQAAKVRASAGRFGGFVAPPAQPRSGGNSLLAALSMFAPNTAGLPSIPTPSMPDLGIHPISWFDQLRGIKPTIPTRPMRNPYDPHGQGVTGAVNNYYGVQ